MARGRAAADPLEELTKSGPRPVYAIDGEERVLVDEAVRKIKEHALTPAARDFNFDVFTGKEASISRILEAAKTLPAFAPRRLVLVTQADKLDLDGSNELIAYLADPSPTTVLVFVADKLDARTKIYKAFTKAGAVLRYGRPRPREMPEIVKSRARAMGIKIDSDAAHLLAEHVGPDVTAASQALELLALYVGPSEKRAIAMADVENVVSTTREESVFALADAIGSQDRSAALRGLHAMLSVSREHPLRILAMIARHYRNLIKARSALDARRSRAEIQSLVGIPPYFLDNLLAQARRQPTPRLVAGLAAIAETDRALKGGALSGTQAMERLLLRLMAA